jgi:protocatechuate 3,4-dioxygenase, alpha subunit
MPKSKKLHLPSQTIGPFFHKGLKLEQGTTATSASERESTTLWGTVSDGAGAPIGDCLLEFWQVGVSGKFTSSANSSKLPHGFARAATDAKGIFRIHFVMPPKSTLQEQTFAPHLNVMLFARGLLTPTFTRVYFADQLAELADDPVIAAVNDATRAQTLLAKREASGSYKWNIVMQGDQETVFLER